MPRGHEQDLMYLHQYLRALFGTIFLYVFLEKDCNEKKDRSAVFGCNNDRLFPEKYTLKFPFCPKSARKYWASTSPPPGHPIILLKSNKFNMATVSLKRSIQGVWGDFVSRSVAGLWYLSETSHPPPPTERVNFPPWPHPICYRPPPPPPSSHTHTHKSAGKLPSKSGCRS